MQPTNLTEVNTVLSRLHINFNQMQSAQTFRISVQCWLSLSTLAAYEIRVLAVMFTAIDFLFQFYVYFVRQYILNVS